MVAPVVAAGIIGAGASLAGNLFGMSSAKKEAKRSRAWQEYMSNTAHQREVADLRAAGLNPLLSVNRGASTPAGAMANIQQDIGSQTVSSARKAMEMTLQQKQEKLLDSQTWKTTQEEDVLHAEQLKKEVETELLKLQLPEATANALIYESAVGEGLKLMQKLGLNASSAKSLIQGAKGVMRSSPVKTSKPISDAVNKTLKKSWRPGVMSPYIPKGKR